MLRFYERDEGGDLIGTITVVDERGARTQYTGGYLRQGVDEMTFAFDCIKAP